MQIQTFKAFFIASLSNPMMIVPFMSRTGTPIWPDFSIMSLLALSSSATFRSLNAIFLSFRNSFAILQKGHVGVEYTRTFGLSDFFAGMISSPQPYICMRLYKFFAERLQYDVQIHSYKRHKRQQHQYSKDNHQLKAQAPYIRYG